MNVDRFLIHTVVVAAFAGVDAAGDPTFGARRTLAARVERGSSKVAVSGGKEVFSSTQILTKERIGEQDRVWVGAADVNDANAASTPLAVNEAAGVRGGPTFFMTHL